MGERGRNWSKRKPLMSWRVFESVVFLGVWGMFDMPLISLMEPLRKLKVLGSILRK